MTYSIIRDGFVVARKPHSCFWCREEIAKGERHWSQSQAYEGRIDTFRLHELCEHAWKRWYEQNKDDDFGDGLDPWDDEFGRPVRGGWAQTARDGQ